MAEETSDTRDARVHPVQEGAAGVNTSVCGKITFNVKKNMIFCHEYVQIKPLFHSTF